MNAARDCAPSQVEFVYERCDGGWRGRCTELPELTADGASFLTVDLALAPRVAAVLEARHGEALVVNVTPGDAEAIGEGRHSRWLRVAPAYTPCTLPPASARAD